MLLQGVVLFIFLIVKVLYSMKTKPILESDWQRMTEAEKQAYLNGKALWTRINNHFTWKIIVTIFLIFIVECTSFAVYNFHHESYDYSHGLFKLSLIFAIVWAVIMFLLWCMDISAPLKDDITLDSTEHSDRWFFTYQGLRRETLRKLFQGL
jgi:uncharacterized membrane protein